MASDSRWTVGLCFSITEDRESRSGIAPEGLVYPIDVMLKHEAAVFLCWLVILPYNFCYFALRLPNSLPFVDARILSLALNTFRLAAAVSAVSVPLGTLLAWLLVRSDLLGRRLWLALLALMLFVSNT